MPKNYNKKQNPREIACSFKSHQIKKARKTRLKVATTSHSFYFSFSVWLSVCLCVFLFPFGFHFNGIVRCVQCIEEVILWQCEGVWCHSGIKGYVQRMPSINSKIVGEKLFFFFKQNFYRNDDAKYRIEVTKSEKKMKMKNVFQWI